MNCKVDEYKGTSFYQYDEGMNEEELFKIIKENFPKNLEILKPSPRFWKDLWNSILNNKTHPYPFDYHNSIVLIRKAHLLSVEQTSFINTMIEKGYSIVVTFEKEKYPFKMTYDGKTIGPWKKEEDERINKIIINEFNNYLKRTSPDDIDFILKLARRLNESILWEDFSDDFGSSEEEKEEKRKYFANKAIGKFLSFLGKNFRWAFNPNEISLLHAFYKIPMYSSFSYEYDMLTESYEEEEVIEKLAKLYRVEPLTIQYRITIMNHSRELYKQKTKKRG
jgi:hypothetical protein